MHFINPDETFTLVIHRVGNRATEEDIHLSKTLSFYPPELTETLYGFLTKPFKTDEYFQFKTEENLVFDAVKNVFEDPTQLLQNSVRIAEHLYKTGSHPKTKGGELWMVFFPDALVEGENASAIGIFKSESKERILKTVPNENSYEIWTEEGISLSKIDKGCLIFNLHEQDGYLLASIDHSKRDDFGIWADEFLQITQVQNEYFDTE